ncbi:MAG TPA: 4-(cytidine 5'-diphospho)-2-C-methyl-D-erythritol kinase [Tissierellia bacterium]|nr:4-(cytidine 5'-diphospho)-2-C-methyl-D-erythritol kinase [Tissierellia bacterium]
MEEIILDAYGKINLALDVLYKRNDGYHEIDSVMQQIDLKDTLILKKRDNGISIESNEKSIPLDERNLAYKAWRKLTDKAKINKGVDITIIKRIPVAAGLAGGSTDAAAVLKGLNILWGLNLSQEELMEIGREIGADVPFCIFGGTARAKGIGERLERIKGFSNKLILLVNIGVEVPTEYVYKSLGLNNKNMAVNVEELVKYIERDNLRKVAENMGNVLESVVIRDYPIIDEIKKEMVESGALGALMSGSGPTVFGIFDDESKLYSCKEKMEAKYKKVIVTKTI